jgi:hypothetical protein
MTKEEFVQKLIVLNACRGSIEWVQTTPGTPEEVWKKCDRSEWLQFLIRNLRLDFDWDTYFAKREEHWDEYRRQVQPLREARDSSPGAYSQWDDPRSKPIWDEYYRKAIPLEEELESKLVTAIRSMVTWAEIEPVLMKIDATI